MKKQILISLLLTTCLGAFSQTKTLAIFSQSTCNNCKYTKSILQKNEITFVNFQLEEKENAIEMQRRLNKIGYHASIYLPVIFENDSILLYPEATHNDSTLYFVLQKVILNKGEYASDTSFVKHTPIESIEKDKADCDFQPMNKYLICGNFKELVEAERFKKVLVADGYLLADIIFYKGFYRVYTTMLSDSENEIVALNELRRQYRGAYIFVKE